MRRVLVTGANGFVGSHLTRTLSSSGLSVRAATRLANWQPTGDNIEAIVVADISDTTEWSQALAGVECIIHLAARVHVLSDDESNPLDSFRAVNTHGTIRLARQASAHGVRRFVYLSSIKACANTGEHPVSESEPAAPIDPYGRSKFEAELELIEIARTGTMDVVIIRPPLVYGPGVGANFRRLLDVVKYRIPLPLAAVQNSRSLVCIDNLCDLIRSCLENPAAANQVFNVSDGADMSTPEILQKIGGAMGRRPLLFPLPSQLLRWGFLMLGRSDDYQRLFGSLQVDIRKARGVIGWRPKTSVDEGLKKTVDWYRSL